jgi:hypothetical protein
MRSLAGLVLSSLLSVLLACHPHPAPSSPELQAASPPRVFVEQRGAPPPGYVELGPSCPAEVGLAPTAFFSDQLLIRLPPEIDGEQLSKGSKVLRSARPLKMGCEDGLSASVFVVRSYTQGPLASERVQLFGDLNFPKQIETTILRGSDNDGDVSMSLAFPDDAVWGTTRVYLRMINRHGLVYGIGFITDASSYHRLEPVFAASANTMVALRQPA